jgi:hypothetical protein
VASSLVKVHQVRADRKKPDYAAKICTAVKEIGGGKLAYVVDFCCFKPDECRLIFSDLLEPLSRQEKLVKNVKYVFISTDSTYEASAILIDSFAHKFANPVKQISGIPKFPKNDSLSMYRQTYSKFYSSGGVREECGYPLLQSLTSPASDHE